MLVLLVEDDLDLAELVIEYLESRSVECDIAYNGVMGLGLIEKNRYDVIILDVMMPRMDGFTLLESLREMGVDTPCLMLTARDRIEDKLSGFDRGADDYMVKPFDLAELNARIHVIAGRRTTNRGALRVADLTLDSGTKEVTRGGRPLHLSPIEWKLLECLMRKSPDVVPRSELEDLIWEHQAPSRDALKMHLYRLRKGVDPKGAEPLIRTVRGAGVALCAPGPEGKEE